MDWNGKLCVDRREWFVLPPPPKAPSSALALETGLSCTMNLTCHFCGSFKLQFASEVSKMQVLLPLRLQLSLINKLLFAYFVDYTYDEKALRGRCNCKEGRRAFNLLDPVQFAERMWQTLIPV